MGGHMKNEFMALAYHEAEKAFNLGEVPVGAVIVKDKKVIAASHNQTQRTKNPTAHAEWLAIQHACKALDNWRLEECSLYVTLEPCPMCASVIMLTRIDKVYFGAYDAQNGACGGFVDLFQQKLYDNKTQVYGGICQEKCSTLLKKFFKNLR